MKVKMLAVAGIMAMEIFASCGENLVAYEQGDIKIFIKEGSAYTHDFELFWGIKKNNVPQMAIWIEDLSGNYLTTIYVTHSIATQSWTAAGGDRRKSALPVWCHSRGIPYPDGLYLPTKKEPVADGISGATPKGSFDVKLRPVGDLKQFVVKIEVNHSTDWNDHFPKDAKEGDVNYSGGKGGSGQPAVVYSAIIDLNSGSKQYTANIVGHSSPDGSDGNIYTDISSLTSALDIIQEIIINIQ